ncbi:hypothetical protein EUTSA_v10003040mg, partial [Eutrema salsugineum]
MTKLLDLSNDLEEEILSRVPVTLMGQLPYTCKRWGALFKDIKFIKKQLNKTANQYLVLMLKDYKVFTVNLDGIHSNIVDSTKEFKGGLILNDLHRNSEKVRIFEVFSCDGLLLCTAEYDRLFVWNPCNGQTRWIQPSACNKKTLSRVALGYENKNSCHSYKILRCWEENHKLCWANNFQPDVRVLNMVAHDCFIIKTNGVSLKGNNYSLFYNGSNFLLRFDFTTEQFTRLSLPFASAYNDTLTMSSVRDEQISVLHQTRGTLEVKIWVTTNDKIDQNEVLSWRKLLAVDITIHTVHRCPFSSSRLSFFIDEEKKMAVCCDERYVDVKKTIIRNVLCIIEEDKYKEIPFGDTYRSCWSNTKKGDIACIFNYVPSFAQI